MKLHHHLKGIAEKEAMTTIGKKIMALMLRIQLQLFVKPQWSDQKICAPIS
jgi:hypothetical protein